MAVNIVGADSARDNVIAFPMTTERCLSLDLSRCRTQPQLDRWLLRFRLTNGLSTTATRRLSDRLCERVDLLVAGGC